MSLDGFIIDPEDLDPEGIELRRASSIETPGATHLGFGVVK
jgi:hypothetical protein